MITKNSNRPMCSLCETRPARSGGTSRGGYQRWRKHCASCDSAAYRKPRVVDLTCSTCGFEAVDACQIDTVDGRSVCSNCNRLNIKAAKTAKHDQYEVTVDATVGWGDIRL
jgi:hypothetical protein